MEAAMKVFPHARGMPPYERYDLQRQILNSSRAVPALLAEAWARRSYVGAFQEKLSQAFAESNETEVWLAIMNDCGYLSDADCTDLTTRYVHIGGMLARMMRMGPSFKPPSRD